MSSFLQEIEDFLNSGDPAVRKWFLVNTNYWPFFLCGIYLLVVKVIGPYVMKNRKPFDLRLIMLFFNMFLVVAYAACITVTFNCLRQNGSRVLCLDLDVTPGNCEYQIIAAGWVVYLLKYLEFLDTIFFVMRKKDKLITNLHVIHHSVLPLVGWILLRTEKSGFQAYPVLINSFIHILMYSYYGLAALGPAVQKYLWWKRYLTIAQMTQFVFILIIEFVVKPISGCSSAKISRICNLVFATLFLSLFYNFYQQTFKSKDSRTVKSTTTGTSNGMVKESTILHQKSDKKGN